PPPVLSLCSPSAATDLSSPPLHDALPISSARSRRAQGERITWQSPSSSPKAATPPTASTLRTSNRTIPATSPATLKSYRRTTSLDRKSTRLNSSHVKISYAVFCLKKKKQH